MTVDDYFFAKKCAKTHFSLEIQKIVGIIKYKSGVKVHSCKGADFLFLFF